MRPELSLKQKLVDTDLRIWAMLAGVLVILYKIVMQSELNKDAFHYLGAAEFFQQQGLLATINGYGWRGYSALIGMLDYIVPGDILYSAHLLNMLLCLLLIWSFITLVMEYRDSQLTRLFAAITILAWPSVIEIVDYVIRDFGFLAFGLLALLYMIRFHKTGRPLYAAAWVLSMLCAIFFRLEGLVLLAATPLSLLWRTDLSMATRLRLFGIVMLVLAVPAVLALLTAIVSGLNLVELAVFSYRQYLPHLLNYSSLLADSADQLNAILFFDDYVPGHSWHGGPVLVVMSYLYTLAYCLIVVATPIPLLAMFYGYRMQAYAGLEQACYRPLLVSFIASCCYLFLFLSALHFLTWRYCFLATLLLLSFLPLSLEKIYLRCRENGKIKRFHYVFGFLLFYYLVECLISFGASKAYIEEAEDWIQANTNSDTFLLTNSYNIAYTSKLVENYDTISLEPMDYLNHPPRDGYLAIEIKAKDPEVLAAFEQNSGLELVTSFGNRRNDQVLIYRAANHNNSSNGENE